MASKTLRRAILEDLSARGADVPDPLHPERHEALRSRDVRPTERQIALVADVLPLYFERRICVVAINHKCYGGLGANWWVVNGHIKDRLRQH